MQEPTGIETNPTCCLFKHYMRVTKEGGLAVTALLAVVFFLWRLDFGWPLISLWNPLRTLTFYVPTPTEREPANFDALLRQARSIVTELWRLNTAQFPTTPQKSPAVGQLSALLSQATQQLAGRLSLLDKLSGRRQARQRRLDVLGSELQQEISRLQNPPDCSPSHVSLEYGRYNCGFGCTAHHIAYRLAMAFATNRTLMLEHDYGNDFFLPLSNCSRAQIESAKSDGYQYCPTDPKEWTRRLSEVQGNPTAWYRGHLLVYILRPRDPVLRRRLETEVRTLRTGAGGGAYDGPIASIHVRRTDKLYEEAAFHPLDEYMQHVQRFFDVKEVEYSLETGSSSPPPWSQQRRVFLASDDASVFEEARSGYARYEFIGRPRKGSQYENRRSTLGVFAITLDIYLLAASDFVVCTATSNICRLVYELLLAKPQVHGDATFQVQSVDEMYQRYFTRRRWWRAIADFRQEGVKLGDVIPIASTQWDGFVRTACTILSPQETILPTYLFQEITQTVE
nr:unnamed protein product [Spirometra erinaceieuropaei]